MMATLSFPSWNFACADLERMLEENLETNEGDSTPIHRILGLGFYADPDPQLRGFYVDEVSFSSEERVFYHETVSLRHQGVRGGGESLISCVRIVADY